MASRLDYPTGDLEFGQVVQISKAASVPGAAFGGVSQNTLSTTAEKILSDRPTRKSALILNTDATISVYVGTNSSVSSSNGFVIKAGASLSVTAGIEWWAVAASGTPVIAIIEEWS